MPLLHCPRCREPFNGTCAANEWLSCSNCNHRWMPGVVKKDTPPTALPVASPVAVRRVAPVPAANRVPVATAVPVVPPVALPVALPLALPVAAPVLVAAPTPVFAAPIVPPPLPPPPIPPPPLPTPPSVVPAAPRPPAPAIAIPAAVSLPSVSGMPAITPPVDVAPAHQSALVPSSTVAPEFEEAPLASPPVAPFSAAADVLAVGKPRSDTGEYAPDETGQLQAKALTSRREGSAPPMANSRRNDSLPVAQPARSAAAAPPASVEDKQQSGSFDPDLFDRMARDAQAQRAQRKTIAEDPPVAPAVPRVMTCPVCGHGFQAVAGDSDQQSCPQCHTSFNLSNGKMVSGDHSGGGPVDPLIGRALRGCLIDRKIGEGGMGAVYHARQLSLDRSVAVKVLPAELARNRNFISRFEREAKSLAKINHPNILHIYDFGEEPQLGIYFMIIEFVEGRDLGERLHEQFCLGQIEVLDIVRQAALGLEMAADKGVIHRDIKPDNLMLTAEGICKVSDFGLAKGYGAERDVTNVGVRVGTPAFMSPEQCDGVEVDFRSDIYNLGCTAFLALTGSLPYDADTPFAIMLKHKNDPVPSLASFNPKVNPRVDALVQRMIAKRPANRFASLRELVDLVEALEVELAGTTTILRKGRGPFRPMAEVEAFEHAKMTSKGQRVAPSPPVLEAPSPREASSRDRQPLTAPASNEPVPEWLRPVEQPAIAKKPSTVIEAPSITRPPSSSPQHASGSGMRDLRLKLAEARNRNLQEEAVTLAAAGERLASAGQHNEAAEAWQRASRINPNLKESQELANLALRARSRSSRQRMWRSFLITILVLALMVAAVWKLTPVVHNTLAEYQLENLPDNPDPIMRLRVLDDFIKANRQPYPWYALFFGNYHLDAVDKAMDKARSLHPAQGNQTVGHSELNSAALHSHAAGTDDDLARLEKMRDDAHLPWAVLQREAEKVVAASVSPSKERAQAILEVALKHLLQFDADCAQFKAAWAAGDQAAVREQSEQFRTQHTRIGEWLPQVLPGHLEISGSDGGTAPLHVRVVIRPQGTPNGALVLSTASHLLAKEGHFSRLANRDEILEVSAPGYRTELLSIPANAESKEVDYSIVLHPATFWVCQPVAAPAWMHLERCDEQRVLVRTPDKVLLLNLSDGGVISSLSRNDVEVAKAPAVADGHWSTAWSRNGDNAIIASDDGTVVELSSLETGRLSVQGVIYHTKSPVLCYAQADYVQHDQPAAAVRSTAYIIEGVGPSQRLIARADDKTIWAKPVINAVIEPMLWFHADQVLVVDDQRIQSFDQGDGHAIAQAKFTAQRTGSPVRLDHDSYLAVPTTAGTDLFHLPTDGGMRLDALHDPLLDECASKVIAGDDQELMVTRGDHDVRLLSWQAGHFTKAWSATLPASSGRIISMNLTPMHGLVADDLGGIYVIARSDGSLLSHVTGSASVICPPIEMGTTLIAGDRDGRLSAYAMPSSP